MLTFLFLLNCINASRTIVYNQQSDPIQFLYSYLDRSDFNRAYKSVKGRIRNDLGLLLNSRDHDILLSRILEQDLKHLSLSSFLPQILEHIQDRKTTSLLYKQIFSDNRNQLQYIAKKASKKVLGDLFFNAFKYKNQNTLELVRNRLSNEQINLLFHEIVQWDPEEKLNVFKNLLKYFTLEKLQTVSMDILIALYEYSVQNKDDWLDILSFDKVQEKITEFMNEGIKVWDSGTIMQFIKDVFRIWDRLGQIARINFFFNAMSWDPVFVQNLVVVNI